MNRAFSGILSNASPSKFAAAGCLGRFCNSFTVRSVVEDGAWRVSSFGRVRSPAGLATHGSLTKSGYKKVQIHGRTYLVHRLVATAFLGPPPTADQWQVNHIDLDPSNNHVGNLQWVTAAQNALHSWKTNVRRTAGEVFKSKPTLWRPCHTHSWLLCSSQKEAAEMSGVSWVAVSRCCVGLQKKSFANASWHEFKPAGAAEPFRDELWEAGRYPGDNEPLHGILVSSCGRVRFATKHHRHTTFGCSTAEGYCTVQAAGRQRLVHRMVAASFLGQPVPPRTQVNHKDGNRANNRLVNLEYASPSENMLHSFSAGIRVPSGKGIPVKARRPSAAAEWQKFPSIRAGALHTGVQVHRIAALCRAGGADASLNWEFRFAVEEDIPGEEWRSVVLEEARAQGPQRSSM